MAENIEREQVTFPSTDGTSTVRATLWWPTGSKPKGVVQLVHGMAEHIGRYDDFACFLAKNGYLVAGHDQVGHGRTTPPEHWGELPMRNGAEVLVEDVDRMRALVETRVDASVPYFVFGHSLGSFIVRSYISHHAEGLAGAIICGTGYLEPSASRLAHGLSWVSAFFRGENHRSKLIDSLGAGGYGRTIPDAKTDYDWLSYDRENVNRYIADPACGFMFSVSGYYAMTALTEEVNDPACAERVPRGLPLLYIAGADDPVGDCGEGVRKAAELARDAGSTDVTVTIYAGMRHEILNDIGHERVYGDVLSWISEHLPKDNAAPVVSAADTTDSPSEKEA